MRDEFLLLSQNVSRFAGIYVNGDERLVLRVARANRRLDSQESGAVQAFARGHNVSDAAAASILVEGADYSYRELDQAMQDVARRIAAQRLGVELWIDETLNRVRIRTFSDADATVARSLVSDLPLVTVINEPEARPRPGQSMQSYRRPVLAGFMGSFVGSDAYQNSCTIGFGAYVIPFGGSGGSPDPSLGDHVLVNSHCGDVATLDTLQVWYQPTVAPGNQIGVQVDNAQRLPQVAVPGCTDPDGCMLADVALVKLNPGVTLAWGQHSVAQIRPTGSPVPNLIFPRTHLTQVPFINAIVGTKLYKVGFVTGNSQEASVAAVCGTLTIPNVRTGFPSESYTVSCVTRVGTLAGPRLAQQGDSGAPVTALYSSGWRAMGMLFALNGFGSEFWYSPASQIATAMSTTVSF